MTGPMTRAQGNALLEALTCKVFGEPSQRDLRTYQRNNSYSLLGVDAMRSLETFGRLAPAIVDEFKSGLADLACEFARGVSDGNFHYVGTVGDLSWLLAYGGAFYVEGQITTPHLRYAVAQPSMWLLRNVDTSPITMSRVRFRQSFEEAQWIDAASAERVTIAPGADLLVNGLEELIWPTSQAEFFIRLMSLPIGAYEVVFDLETGNRIGMFTTDIRVATVENVLRILGYARCPAGEALAAKVRTHTLRELRWAAMNYHWRLGGPDLGRVLQQFGADEDAGIRAIAAKAIASASATQ